jgi:hypothetical protein
MENPLSSLVGEAKGLGGEFKAKGEMLQGAKEALKPPAPPVAPPKAKGTMVYPKDKVSPGGKYGDKPGEKRIDTSGYSKPLGQMHAGGTVPESGMYKMKKGEHVLTKDQHGNMNHAFDLAGSVLAHQMPKPDVQKKDIKEMHMRKGASGGFIVKHVHVDPMHPDEEHVHTSMDGVHGHLEDHWGEPNEGEKEADAGDPGIEAAEHAVGLK